MSLIKGKTRPTEIRLTRGTSPTFPLTLGSQSEFHTVNKNLLVVLFFLLTEQQPPLLVLELSDETGTAGNGQKTPQGGLQEDLVAKYNTVTDEAVRSTTGMLRVVKLNKKPVEDPTKC